MKASTAYRRLIRLSCEMMAEAHQVGRYPPPHNAREFMERDKSKAFRCIAYERLIRDISALEEALVLLKWEEARNVNQPH